MNLVLKEKMISLIELISEREKKKNKKLLGQIEFLRKYLGALGEGSGGIRDDSDLDFQKYFNFKLHKLEA